MCRVLCLLALVFFLVSQVLLGQDEDPILARLAEIEKRLEALEKAKEAEPNQAQAVKSAQTVEVAELNRQVDILAEDTMDGIA